MYHSASRHESLETIQLRRPFPSKHAPGPHPLEVALYSRDLYVSLSLEEAAALHERLGKILDRAKAVATEEPGTVLSLTFDR